MKKIISLIVLFLFIGSSVALAKPYSGYSSRDWLRCTTGTFLNAQAVTATNTVITLSQDTKALYIKNVGANEVYVDPRDGIAVANDNDGGIKIESGDDFELSAFQTRSFGVIASSGETSTVQIITCS